MEEAIMQYDVFKGDQLLSRFVNLDHAINEATRLLRETGDPHHVVMNPLKDTVNRDLQSKNVINIPLVFLPYKGKEVVTVTHLEDAINHTKTLVSRSTIYLNAKNDENIIDGVDYLFHQQRPENVDDFHKFADKYKHLKFAKVSRLNEHLLTRSGVIKILKTLEIDPGTLRSVYEPEIDAPKQKSLFAEAENIVKNANLSVHSELSNIVYEQSTKRDFSQPDKDETKEKEYNKRIYIRSESSQSSKILTGFSKGLSLHIAEHFPLVKYALQKRQSLYLTAMHNGNSIIFQFTLRKTENSFIVRRKASKGEFTNFAVQREGNEKLVSMLKEGKFEGKSTKNLVIENNMNLIIANF